MVFDLKYNNSIGSNGRTRYAAFVNAGGILTLVGENHVNHSNNNNTTERNKSKIFKFVVLGKNNK